MTLKKTFVLSYTAIITGICVLGLLGVLLKHNGEGMKAKYEQRYHSYLLADQLRQSSDDLTRMARTYVITGDTKYEKMYWDILAIRNGEKPRPVHYDRVYWDLVSDYGINPRPDGKREPLQALMKRAGFTAQELAKLAEAQANSDALVTTETIAMNAMKGLYDDGEGNYTRTGTPDPDLAQRIMHDAKYHRDKAIIMEPIDQFFALLDERTLSEVQHYVVSGDRILLITQVLVLVLALLSIVIGISVTRRILRQVGGEPSEIMAIARNVAAGDLRSHAGAGGEGSVGILASIHAMSENLRKQTREIMEGVNLLVASTQDISLSVSQLAASAAQTASALTETSVTLEEVQRTSELAQQQSQHVSDGARQAAQISQDGHKATEDTIEVMLHIREQMGTVSDSIAELSDRSRSIGDIIAAVNALAEQSNMLAVNASLEAAKAGEHGKSFGVVALEMQSLASRSKQATTEVRRNLSDIRNATDVAVKATEEGASAVEAGVHQSTGAGESILSLATHIDATAQSMAQIAASGGEQMVGVDQISKAVRSIQAASEQNVASSHEIESAAHNLHELGQRLKQLVDRYKV